MSSDDIWVQCRYSGTISNKTQFEEAQNPVLNKHVVAAFVSTRETQSEAGCIANMGIIIFQFLKKHYHQHCL